MFSSYFMFFFSLSVEHHKKDESFRNQKLHMNREAKECITYFEKNSNDLLNPLENWLNN